jgi:hypothetical protein
LGREDAAVEVEQKADRVIAIVRRCEIRPTITVEVAHRY